MRVVKLAGKNISLGPIYKKDLALFLKWINDTELTKYLNAHPNVYTFYDEQAFFERISKDKTTRVFAILRKGRTIGSCDLKEIDPVNRTATLGIMIGDKGCWNKGYGTEAMRLLLEYGFATLNLKNIMLKVYAFNERAIRVYEKCGFRVIGRRRKARFYDGQYYDEVFMDILADECLII